MRRFFIDMDGTMTEWEYVSPETLRSDGYFARLRPHRNVVNAVLRLVMEGEDVYVLSAYLTDSAYALRDKNAWLDRYMPFIAPEKRIFVPYGSDKHSYVPGGVHPDDVLLDDYTLNLLGWAKHSGKGVKLLNGVNNTHRTWKGITTRYDESPVAIACAIAAAAAN